MISHHQNIGPSTSFSKIRLAMFRPSSSVVELLSHVQALAYQRDRLKFDGSFLHSRRISHLLAEIGRKAIQLIDPVTRLARVR